jgi:hypothetical protein
LIYKDYCGKNRYISHSAQSLIGRIKRNLKGLMGRISMLLRTKKIIAGIGIAFTCLVAPAVYRENFSDKIKNTNDLMKIIKEEAPLARKDSPQKHIFWQFGQTPWETAASAKISESNYMIILDKKRTRTAVRHELYHIYGEHCDDAFAKGEWTTSAKIRDEITANIYAWYGLRF